MGKQLQTIYEYLGEYTEAEINSVISKLGDEEKKIILLRYGKDLHNPKTSENWNREYSQKFYNLVVPKLRKILLLSKEQEKTETKQSVDSKMFLPQIGLDENELLLTQFILEGKTNREICKSFNISQRQLADYLLKLKNKGIRSTRKYYSDGSIKYQNVSGVRSLNNCNNMGQDRTIITDTNENSMKILVISDLHFGNELERLDLVDRAYNYCVKNGINIILCGGDLIDGAFTKGKQKISDLYKQVEYFLQNYPYDKNILTFSVAGDHDMSILYKSFLDIIGVCNNFRHDIIIGGYNNTGINIKSDKILLYHRIESGMMRETDAPIILHGHSHKFLIDYISPTLNVNIPAFCDINQIMPSALELQLKFNHGYISDTIIKHIYFGEHDVVLGEYMFDLSKGRRVPLEIKNIESFRENVSKETTEIQNSVMSKRLTQTEKFNKRYGL